MLMKRNLALVQLHAFAAFCAVHCVLNEDNAVNQVPETLRLLNRAERYFDMRQDGEDIDAMIIADEIHRVRNKWMLILEADPTVQYIANAVTAFTMIFFELAYTTDKTKAPSVFQQAAEIAVYAAAVKRAKNKGYYDEPDENVSILALEYNLISAKFQAFCKKIPSMQQEKYMTPEKQEELRQWIIEKYKNRDEDPPAGIVARSQAYQSRAIQ